MKLSQLLLTVNCLSIIFVLFGVGFALEQDEARVTPIWSNETPDLGSSVLLNIFYINDYVEEVTIERIGVHLDWMEQDSFVGLNLSNNPVTVSSSGSYAFQPITVVIPNDVSYGIHSYFIGVDGIQGESTSFSWDSLTRTIQIQPAGGNNDGGNGGADVDGQPDTLLIIVGVAIVAGVAVLIMILIFKRKKSATSQLSNN